MIKSCSCINDYLRHREQGRNIGSRRMQLELQENLIANNGSKLKSSKLKFLSQNENTKAFLIVMSKDMSFFAVATSDNCVGIYCSISGELVEKLYGSQCPLYTITWHPHIKNIISCSNLSGSVFVWDTSLKNNLKECWFLHSWEWPPFSSITYSIDFHPFSTIMTIARDREIRFVNWSKGHHIAHWRFYSEFSWIPWVSWSCVGNSILVSIGNPQDDSFLHSIMNSVDQDKIVYSPLNTGCSHCDNLICEQCDKCPKMSMLEVNPPSFEEYRVNAVDLIRYVLSRPEDWFLNTFICHDCRIRFKLWANSIQIHNKFSFSSDLNPSDSQLPYDVESNFVTVIESPVAPEVIWETLQNMTETSLSDQRLLKYLIPKSDPLLAAECKSLLRCVAMFERECLRQSICWTCIQHLHCWVLQQEDFPLFLYNSMINVRSKVIQRINFLEMNILPSNVPEDESSLKISATVLEYGSNSQENCFSGNIDDILPSEKNVSPKNKKDDKVKYFTFDNEAVSKVDLLEQPRCKKSSMSTINNEEQNKIAETERLSYLRVTLKLLQVYVAEPSRLGDLINILLTNNLNRMGMLFRPSLYGSKIESYSIRRWHIHPLGQTPQKISPRNDFTESNVIVPYLVFSTTGLTASSIKISKCGRTIAVLVPYNSFRRLHAINHVQNEVYTRKRRHSFAFIRDPMVYDGSSTFSGRENGNVIAVYSSEPESICGQLLYYFEMSFDPISLDFSPLGDLLLVGLSGSKHQSLWTCPSAEKSIQCSSFVDLGLTLNTHCNIGAILKVNNFNKEEYSQSYNANAKRMQLRQVLQQDKNVTYQDCSDMLTWNGPINCAIWNTAGGLLYTKEPGSIFTINFVGCN